MNKLRNKLKMIYDKHICVLFPDKCAFCNRIIFDSEYMMCNSCKKHLPELGFFQGVGGFRCCSPLEYSGKYKNAILAFKAHKKTQYSKIFAQLIYEQIQKSYEDYIFDFIAYIPMYEKDEKKRGFNQSQLIAKDLSKLMNIECIEVVEKTKPTLAQHNLCAKDRRKNLKGAFKAVNKSKIKGKHILLIDDIVTTGTTLRECSKAIEKEKPAQICCATALCTIL